MMCAKSGNSCNSCWTVTVLMWRFISGGRLQWFSASLSPSVLPKSTWNYQPYNNRLVLFHHVWQHKIKCCCDSTLPYLVSQSEANRTIAIAMASSPPPFWPCCWQAGDSPAWAPVQAIRGTSGYQRHFFSHNCKELVRSSPPSPLSVGHAWELHRWWQT